MLYGRVLFLKNLQNTIRVRLKSNWIQPDGFDTKIRVYNCIVRDKVPFIVKNKSYLTWYTCGPTVYDSAHIGHASCYVKLDIIQKILKKHFGLNIVSVMNITDIDDKIINRSNSLSIPSNELSNKYEKEFWKDLETLNITQPDIVLRVTDNIHLITEFIQKLLDENKAYITEDGSVYFDLKQYKTYGKLQNISPTENDQNKKSPGDFALWKAAKPNEPSWESKWSSGRPGWHIECSAMASGIFGSNMDVHAGGIDLRFPHHENEEAQSCSYHDTKQWVNYWFHTGHLNLSNIKMSKSLKNTITIQEITQQINPDTFRMACLMSHYRANMEFTPELIQTAESYLKKVKTFLNDCKSYTNGYFPVANVDVPKLLNLITKTEHDIVESFKDDFNTAKIIKTILELITHTNKVISTPATNPEATNMNTSGVIVVISKFVIDQMDVFGFKSFKRESYDSTANNMYGITNILNTFRQNVRQRALECKDNELLLFCDNVRNDLKDFNVNVQDFKNVSNWNKS